MNTNLTQVIIETIEQSKQVLGEGFDFAKKETPLVIQEFLNWGFIQSIVTGTFFLMVFLLLCYTAIRLWKWVVRARDEETQFFGGLWAFILSMVIVPILWYGVLRNAKTAIQIKVAPRVYLIEWVANNILKNEP